MFWSWALFTLIIISSIPVIAVYVWFRLAKYKFSLVKYLLVLLTGASAFFPALIFQELLNFPLPVSGRLELFYYFFIRIAFTEEFSCLLMLFIFFWISRRIKPEDNNNNNSQLLSYNTVKKGTAIGLVAGLGFALLENAVYGASDTGVLLLRVITASPLHGACGSRIGAAAVLFRSNPIQALFRVFAAVAIHGIYNFLIVMSGLPLIAAILIALSALVSSILTIRGGWNSE